MDVLCKCAFWLLVLGPVIGIARLPVIDPAGGFTASAWNVTATPAVLAGRTLVPKTVVGAEADVAGANTFEVRPVHGYTLSEASNSTVVAYRQVRLEKFDGTSWVTVPSGSIVAPAAGQNAMYRFVNERIPPVMLPLTGGASADAFVYGGGGALALSLIAGVWWSLRRRRSMT